MSENDRNNPRFLPTNKPDEAHLVGIYFESPHELEEHRQRMKHLLESHQVMSAAKGEGHLLLCFITVEDRAKIVAQIEVGLPESAKRTVSYSTKPPRRHSAPPDRASTIPPTANIPHFSGFAPKLTDPPVADNYDESDESKGNPRKTSPYTPSERPSSIPPSY